MTLHLQPVPPHGGNSSRNHPSIVFRRASTTINAQLWSRSCPRHLHLLLCFSGSDDAPISYKGMWNLSAPSMSSNRWISAKFSCIIAVHILELSPKGMILIMRFWLSVSSLKKLKLLKNTHVLNHPSCKTELLFQERIVAKQSFGQLFVCTPRPLTYLGEFL